MKTEFDGVKSIQTIKCIAKSHPLYQEFRLWQFINNLRIYQRQKTVNGKLELDVNVTKEYLKTDEDIVKLFDWLNNEVKLIKKRFKISWIWAKEEAVISDGITSKTTKSIHVMKQDLKF
ncbi:MAG: hypothetical protein R2942_17365 [Ignavibacteria bacterium]